VKPVIAKSQRSVGDATVTEGAVSELDKLRSEPCEREAALSADRRGHPALADAGDAGGEARQHGLRLHYQLIDLDRTATAPRAAALIAAARTMGFAGLNITSRASRR
jgi:hypothetical protein